MIAAIIGHSSIDVSAGSIDSLVNERREHLIGKKLCTVKEVREMNSSFGRNFEAFKSFITDKMMDVRPLYCAKIIVRNLIETIIPSNNQATIPSGKEARRIQMFSLDNKYCQNKEYFKNIYEYINNPVAINHFYTYLMTQVKIDRSPMEPIETAAQAEFREVTQDNVSAFWSFIITETTDVELSKRDAYIRYQAWCESNGEMPRRNQLFSSQSKGIKGIKDDRNNTCRFWAITRSPTKVE